MIVICVLTWLNIYFLYCEIINFFDNNEVVTEKVNGESSFCIIGFEIGLFEILIGLRENNIKYADFTSTIDDNKDLGLDFDIQGKQWFFGGGLSF